MLYEALSKVNETLWQEVHENYEKKSKMAECLLKWSTKKYNKQNKLSGLILALKLYYIALKKITLIIFSVHIKK